METLNIIAKALILGAFARQWAHSHESIVELYLQLKSYLQQQYPAVSLTSLEQSPDSGGIQFILKDDLRNVAAYRDEFLVQLSERLIAVVTQHNPELLDKLAADV